MAVTGVITLNDGSASVAPRHVTSAALVFSSDGAAATVLSVVPSITSPAGASSRAVAADAGSVRPSLPGTVPASGGGSLTLTFDVIAYAPGRGGPTSLTYSVGATVKLSDGTTIEATPDTLTVAAPT